MGTTECQQRQAPEIAVKPCQMDYRRNGSNVTATRGMISESAFSCPCWQPSLLLSTCARSVCSVYMSQLCACLLQPVNSVPVLCMWLLSEINALLVVLCVVQCTNVLALTAYVCLTYSGLTHNVLHSTGCSKQFIMRRIISHCTMCCCSCHLSLQCILFTTSGLPQALLEIIVGMTSDHSQKDAFKGMHRHLLHNASASFSDAVVRLAAELIVVTRHCPNPKFRYVHRSS